MESKSTLRSLLGWGARNRSAAKLWAAHAFRVLVTVFHRDEFSLQAGARAKDASSEKFVEAKCRDQQARRRALPRGRRRLAVRLWFGWLLKPAAFQERLDPWVAAGEIVEEFHRVLTPAAG